MFISENMIVLDIETSGLGARMGIWQIGAIELENLQNYFLQEARIDDGDLVEEGALKVTGKTERELRDISKQSQNQLIINYLDWFERLHNRIICGWNVGWDVTKIEDKCISYDLQARFIDVHGIRIIDLQTLAQEKYLELYKKYLLKENGANAMSLPKALEFCGIIDERIEVRGPSIMKEGRPHDALGDCRLEAEIFFRLKYGRNLFPEFSKFEIPEYLK